MERLVTAGRVRGPGGRQGEAWSYHDGCVFWGIHLRSGRSAVRIRNRSVHSSFSVQKGRHWPGDAPQEVGAAVFQRNGLRGHGLSFWVLEPCMHLSSFCGLWLISAEDLAADSSLCKWAKYIGN